MTTPITDIHDNTGGNTNLDQHAASSTNITTTVSTTSAAASASTTTASVSSINDHQQTLISDNGIGMNRPGPESLSVSAVNLHHHHHPHHQPHPQHHHQQQQHQAHHHPAAINMTNMIGDNNGVVHLENVAIKTDQQQIQQHQVHSIRHLVDRQHLMRSTIDNSIPINSNMEHFVRPIMHEDNTTMQTVNNTANTVDSTIVDNYSVRSLVDNNHPLNVGADDNSLSSSVEEHPVSSMIDDNTMRSIVVDRDPVEHNPTDVNSNFPSRKIDSVQNLVQNVVENIVQQQHQPQTSSSISQITTTSEPHSTTQSIRSYSLVSPIEIHPTSHDVSDNLMVNIKQELDESATHQTSTTEYDEISRRKSLRLSKRIRNVTEIQMDIDSTSMHQHGAEQTYSNEATSIIDNLNEIDDDEDADEDDEDEDDDEDEKKSVDQDFVINDDEDNEEEELDDDNDDDDDSVNDDSDEYRPLKKRRITRRKVKKTHYRRVKANKNSEVSRLKTIIFKLRKHELVMKSYTDILFKMNTSLVDKMFNLINGDTASNISVTRLMEMLRTLQTVKNPSEDTFLEEFGALYEQYKDVSLAKETLEKTIDSDTVDEKEVNDTIGKFLRQKRKFCLMDIIGEMRPAKKVCKVTGRVGRPPKSATGFDGTSTSTNGVKRKRRKLNSEEGGDDEEKSTYHPCPWPNCTYESKREWALNEHINLTHTGLKQFGCKVDGCPSTFFGSAELDNHMKKYHADVASKEFMPCSWPGCNALFKSKLGLRAHIQVHKGENLIPCDWPGCNYLAKNKRQHENHIRKHTGDRPFSCDYPGCDSKFRTNDSLRHHKKSHSEYRPFRCDWPGCEANFKTNRGLTIHRALHTGEKLFKCDWQDCDYASERKYHVDLHIYERHTHVKPYQCTWTGCEASFLRNDKLQNHLKIHRQEKPFKCIHPACDKHFVEKGNMMKHYNNVHKR